MASPALGQPSFLVRAKDAGGLASPESGFRSSQQRGGRRSLGKIAETNTIPLRKSNAKEDGYMSLMLAVPPPPPPTNAPSARNRSQSAARQRQGNVYLTENQRRPLESYDSWDQIQHQQSLPSVVATHSDDFTVSTIASPRHAVLADRFRAARAIYQSDTLVLDAVEEESSPSEHGVVEKTRSLAILPAASSVTATTASRSTVSRRSPTELSDNSGSTEMIRNHSSYEKETSVTPPKRRLKIRTPERVKSTEKEKRPKTPKRLRLAVRPKKGVEASPPKVTPKRRVKAPSKIVQKDAQQSCLDEGASGKGFFGKLFRTGRKKSTVDVQTRSDDATLLTEMRSQSTGPVPQSNSEDEGKDKENSKQDVIKRGTGPSPAGNRYTLHQGRSVHYHGHDEVSTLTAPTFDSFGRRSLDPESGESIISQRVHEPSGRYLQSKGSLDIDTVASYAGSLSDPPEKDDSPTTVNTRRTSIDPTDDTPRTRGSEPRESRARTQHSFRDPSPKHLVRAPNDPSPTETKEEVPFDFEETSSDETERPLGDSSLSYLKGRASLQSVAPDPPLDSVNIESEDEPEEGGELNQGELSVKLSPVVIRSPPPPPPPPRQASFSRSVSIQSTTNKREDVRLRSPGYNLVSESPTGISRTASENQQWKGTDPIDSDLILEQSMNDGIFDVRKDDQQLTKGTRNQQFSMLKAARFNAKTMAYLHAVNGDPSPKQCWNQVGETSKVGKLRNRGKAGSDYSSKNLFVPATQKVPIISNTTRNNQTRKLVETDLVKRLLFNRRKYTSKTQRARNCLWEIQENYTEEKGVKLESASSSKKTEAAETIDPIQRAGQRLLSKSAVPIQSAARRFLAQREAIDRMWGILEIQCYMRRWKAEATLLAYRSSALTIQRVFRGTQVRKDLEVQHEAAVQIQKVIRGYLSCVSTFDAVYRIIVVQSLVRGFLVRTRMRRFEESCREYSATKIQQWWRCVSCQTQYQYFIVDVLIIQSAFRRWRAQREYKAIMDFRCTEAARCIQAAWRGFQSYSDYIFSLVDVIVVQRTARRWLAVRKVEKMRRDKAATQIQSQFRKYSAQYKLLHSLMNAILIQSMLRMFLAKKLVFRKRAEHCKEQKAAIKIQSAWRGFATFTDYIITHYHIVKFQSIFRGFVVRKQAQLRLGSIVIIQSSARKFLVAQSVRRMRVDRIFTYGQLGGIRESSAANRIQFWWRVVLDCRKEKQAALVIERFFLMVKREVDMEIARVQRRKMEKRRFKKDKETLGTVEDETANFSPASKSTSKSNRKSDYLVASSSSPQSRALQRIQKTDSILSSDSLNFTYSADDSEMSGVMYSTSKHYQQKGPRTAAEKYASLYGIRTRKSVESQKKNPHLVDTIENTLSSGSSIQGIQFTASPGSSIGLLSPVEQRHRGTKEVKHFDFDEDSEDEFGLI